MSGPVLRRGSVLTRILHDPPRGQLGQTSRGHLLQLRAGLISREDRGTYTLLSGALTALSRAKALVSEVLESSLANTHKVAMPLLTSSDLWEKSGRWRSAGPELFRLADRGGADMCLAATSEEAAARLAGGLVRAPSDLPLRIYQMGRKYRDEARPRFGLLRAREFVMKDMYSFDETEESAIAGYEAVCSAYARVLPMLIGDGLADDPEIVRVAADTGEIGGSLSHEFHALHPVGEDTVLTCDTCGVSTNVELTPRSATRPAEAGAAAGRDAGETTTHILLLGKHGRASIERWELRTAGGAPPSLTKVRRAVTGAVDAIAVTPERFEQAAGVPRVSAIDLSAATTAAATARVDGDGDGAIVGDFASAADGDPCASCGKGSRLRASRGVELGHAFLLGDRYTDALGATVRGEDGAKTAMVMGCYGIGLTRALAAAVEFGARGDDAFVWPTRIAPHVVGVIDLSSALKRDPEIARASESVAKDIAGVPGLDWRGAVVLDDTDARAGYKFRDAELMGYPVTVTVGKKWATRGVVEIVDRRTDERIETPAHEVPAVIAARLPLGQ